MAPGDDSSGDIRARVVFVEHRVQDHKSRLASIEKWIADANVADARREERWNGMLKRLDSIDNNIRWVTKLIVGGIVTATLAFIAGGGLNVVK